DGNSDSEDRSATARCRQRRARAAAEQRHLRSDRGEVRSGREQAVSDHGEPGQGVAVTAVAPFDLQGKVAVVTGGNGGIGLGMARGLASARARVVVAARNAEKSSAAARELQALGTEAIALSVDVTVESSVDAMFAETVAHFGRLDILVNNAGINI